MGTSLKDRCRVATNFDADTFVGIKMEKGQVDVSFPIGYDLSDLDDEKLIRNDILVLMSSLARFSEKRDGIITEYRDGDNLSNFPIKSYLYVIKDYLSNGYYHEKEIKYDDKSKGKISWKRTIQQKQPSVSNNSIVYLDVIKKTEVTNYETYIAKIHEYCVYISFLKLGWIYTEYVPSKPNIDFNQRAFSAVIKQQLSVSFDDKKKLLFLAMLDVVNSIENQDDVNSDFTYGTHRFEYVWENMIDFVFGENNKDYYFPHATWTLIEESKERQSSALEPDTIMLFENNAYILDAKYYKYGITKNANDLPATASVNKQLTYADYLFGDSHPSTYSSIYNAFIMPFNMRKENDAYIKFVGFSTGDWRISNGEKYENIYAILIDVKYLMSMQFKHDEEEISKLAEFIDKIEIDQ